MMYLVNINPNLPNFSGNEKVTFSDNSSDFKDFFKEFLDLIVKNKDFRDNSDIFFIPFQGLPVQGINNLYDFLQVFDIKGDKTAIYELLGDGKIDFKELKLLLEDLKNKSVSNENLTLLEEFIETNSTNLELNQIEDIFKKLSSQQNKSDTDLAIFKINGEDDKLKENLSNILDTINKNFSNNKRIELKVDKHLSLMNEEFLKLSENKTDGININIEQKIKNDSIASQFNINSVQDNNNINNIQQKMELPFTRINEMSDIIFRALSSSQKTLVVQLEPPELGRILIKLSMDNSGVRADMKVDYPYVKEALTALIPEIKSNLHSSGIKISDFFLDLMRDQRGYSDSYYGQGQKKYKDNQKFFEYFA